MVIFLSFKAFHDPYFENKISLHRPCSSFPSLHFHLPRRALLNLLKLFIPHPPFSLGLHMVSHFTHAIFLPSWPHPHIMSICILTISFLIVGILKSDMKNRGMADC